MIRYILSILIAVIIAVPSGYYGSIYIFKNFDGFSHFTIGQWKSSPIAGTSEADPYAKAHRLQQHSTSLGKAEGLTFLASHDDKGQQFNSNCTYKIIGNLPIGRFFTIHARDTNFLSIDVNAPYTSVLNSDTLIFNNNGDIEIKISAYAQSGNWLYIPKNKLYNIVFTLYDTPINSERGLTDPLMPKIIRIKDSNCD